MSVIDADQIIPLADSGGMEALVTSGLVRRIGGSNFRHFSFPDLRIGCL